MARHVDCGMPHQQHPVFRRDFGLLQVLPKSICCKPCMRTQTRLARSFTFCYAELCPARKRSIPGRPYVAAGSAGLHEPSRCRIYELPNGDGVCCVCGAIGGLQPVCECGHRWYSFCQGDRWTPLIQCDQIKGGNCARGPAQQVVQPIPASLVYFVAHEIDMRLHRRACFFRLARQDRLAESAVLA
jgi:hypothetical protein